MNIYAIKDRLIGYFLVPFAAHTDREVLAAVAATINSETSTDAISQAPHHFEIWRLAEIDDQGHITPSREFVQDCAGLVRDHIRHQRHNEPRSHQDGETHPRQPMAAPGTDGRPIAYQSPPGGSTPSTPVERT